MSAKMTIGEICAMVNSLNTRYREWLQGQGDVSPESCAIAASDHFDGLCDMWGELHRAGVVETECPGWRDCRDCGEEVGVISRRLLSGRMVRAYPGKVAREITPGGEVIRGVRSRDGRFRVDGHGRQHPVVKSELQGRIDAEIKRCGGVPPG